MSSIQPEALYSEFINQVEEYAIFGMDPRGSITTWNKGAERIKGYLEAEIIGQNYRILFTEEGMREGKPEQELILACERGKFEAEAWRRRKDGTHFWAKVTLTPIYDPDQVLAGYTKITRDLTKQKAHQEALSRQHEQLQKVNKELDAFVYRAGHDLRAPLMSVLGLVNIVKSEQDPAQQQVYLDLVEQSIHKLDHFISDIIDYSRNARTELVYQKIEAKSFLEEIISQLAYSKEKPVDFQLTIDPKGTFYSDPIRLRVVLHNLISNAIRYSHPHRLTSIILTVETKANTVQMSVTDNGIGIGCEHLDKIFDMFYRATTNKSGSGLGLYIVKEIIERIQGTIKVESQVDVGTTFEFVIPNQKPN